ncbi:hypothetical protein EV421DRAFT_1684510, partial [Armillaria borealis]
PETIHVVKEKEAIRILGAWFGNNIDDCVVWSSQLEKIDSALESWERSNPTIQGRRLIVSMVVGAMTQYLTTVQGMPKTIEKQMIKRIRKFMWGDKTQSPVNFDTLLAPRTEG